MKYLPWTGVDTMAWTMTALATILTIGRFLIAWRARKAFAACEYFNAAAAVFMIAFFGCWQSFVPSEYALAVLKSKVSDEVWREQTITFNPLTHLRLNIATSVLYWSAIYSVKWSFLFMYRTIFWTDVRFRPYWIVAAVYTGLAWFFSVFIRFFMCGKIADVLAYFTKCPPHTVERNMKLGVAWCIMDGLSDIFLVAMPLAMLPQMFLHRGHKIQLAILFSLVLFNILTNVLRTYFTVDPVFMKEAHINSVWIILQLTVAVSICALPCYGSQITRRKQKKPDGILVIGHTGLVDSTNSLNHTAGYSLESFGTSGLVHKDNDGVLTPLRAIKVRDRRDVVHQDVADSMHLPADRRTRHSVTIWS